VVKARRYIFRGQSDFMDIVIRNIANEFVVVDPDKKATVEPVDPMLYQRIEKNYEGFKSHELISSYEFSCDWNTWEIHPHGDEIVLLLSGEITLILQLNGGQKSVTLTELGSYIIVPKGIWHTAKTIVPSKLLFITPGEGTLNKDVPE
tara:strand:- start:126218 stop:126661 length:444 start_codon:yes stop_codon:yes gene_type:complete